jgi:hypothetical protein
MMANKDTQHQGNKTIVFTIKKSDYAKFMSNSDYAKTIINKAKLKQPELFPSSIQEQGYCLNGKTRTSKKCGYSMIKIKIGTENYQIRPSFLLPSGRGLTAVASKALLMMKYNLPFHVIAIILGKYPMYWYRLFLSIGHYSIVGTTIKNAKKLPCHLLADEEHTKVKGKKRYIATTVGSGCILGAALTKTASEEDLTNGYRIFKAESQDIQPLYAPKTVNTDGWFGTQNSWKALFPKIVIIQCFLHAFIKIRDRAVKKVQDVFKEISEKVWDSYKATNKRSFSQCIRRLREWAQTNVSECMMKEQLIDLCSKTQRWQKFYDFPMSHRTSNALDRLMKFMSRHIYNHQYFHGSTAAATLNMRAYALIYNFAPSCPSTVKKYNGMNSPAERLNGFKYHEDWLQNLLISASLAGYRNYHSKTL